MTGPRSDEHQRHPRSVGGSARDKQSLSRRVHDLLRADIRAGVLAQDSMLVEERLMSTLDASRHSVREALQQLSDEGLIQRLPGQGTRVVQRIIEMPLDDIRPAGVGGRFAVRCSDRRIVPSTPLLRQRLGTEDARLGFVEHHFLLDGEPVGVRAVYHRSDVEQPQSWDEVPSLDAGFAFVFGRPLTEVRSTIDAAVADAKTARMLGTKVGAPVLVVEQVLTDDAGVTREFTFTRYRADRLSLTVVNSRMAVAPTA